MVDYADRTSSDNADGTPLFASDYDLANEERAKAAIEAAWSCTLHRFGRLCAIDFYALRAGRLVGFVEVKSRTHESARFDTVFLNVRKWLALMLAEVGLGAPSIFVANFTDTIKFMPVAEIDARRVRLGGTAQIVKSHSDIEPVIEVPVSAMRTIPLAAP